jgi:hypothetical protein
LIDGLGVPSGRYRAYLPFLLPANHAQLGQWVPSRKLANSWNVLWPRGPRSEVFEEAWNEIAGNFGSIPYAPGDRVRLGEERAVSVESARVNLADALLAEA